MMQVLGDGFLARNLRHLAPGRAHVVLLAAGVSTSSNFTSHDVRREEQFVRTVATRCAASSALLVYFSSIGPLGADDGGVRVESDEIRPSSAYGRHKAAMEQLVRDGATRHLILRMSNLAGRDQNPGQLIPALAQQVILGRVCLQKGALRDVLDVRDAVELIGTLLQNDIRDTVVNVASGMSVPVDDLVDHLSFLLGRTPTVDGVEAGGGYRADITLLKSLVGTDGTLSRISPTYYRDVLDRHYGVAAQR